ncbi:hypothetical protein BACT_1087 [Bifidobacterium actinocoloniiforme DSM 22766]|uniref:Uncharacterized protein n=1 Tax=Bifidobacterium actinocoloniiforme DSM 22766 TaxID=1437605 RepID=A0A086Z1I5_9BIFI|nr:hypothetical protein [Bifidobacterium actinocoloniiforme]AKV55523.1 hypothetical protein AB656_04050 [Bifidobacterium actinocoloniiforme DSM 22766]KFI40385.1 hypothetical protein BACT_1087 [Bifidobacterium actinocoloniiforme DSM 22766]
MKAVRMIWGLLGSPQPEGAAAKLLSESESVCKVCGTRQAVTADASKALGSNFTDRSLYASPESGRVCDCCLWACSGRGVRTIRMWSVAAAPGVTLPDSQEKAAAWIGQHDGICLTSRHDTSPILGLLLNPPESEWAVSIAVSGQKHVMPYTGLNHGPTGMIRMETADVPYTQEAFSAAYRPALELRRMGASAEMVQAGQPPRFEGMEQAKAWKRLNSDINPWKGSPILDLALWAITKPIMEGNHS